MPDETTILSLPLILPAQAQKHVTHNEALARLDLIVQLAVIDRVRTTPPALPAVGDRHIVAAAATGPWAGQAGRIALYTQTGWQFTQPLPGWQAYVMIEQQMAFFDGLTWVALSDGPFSVGRLGISATADATNRLAVSAPATLLNHAGAGHQLKLNKAAASDTASLLFQTGFAGRAEMGTAGSDDFGIKVSPDGSVWRSGLVVEGASGEVTLPQPLHLGGQAADPVAPPDGTLWLDATSGEVRVRSGGVTLPLGGGGGIADGDRGDVTVSGGGAVWTVDAGAIGNAKLGAMASGTVKGRASAGAGVPEDLSPAQVRGLINVADGATANATDAALRDRATHTGTQAASTITGLAAVATSGSASDLATGTLPGARIADGALSLAKLANSPTGTILGRVAAGSGATERLTAEQVRGILNVAEGATANAGDAALRDRASHTGTQSATTISDFAASARGQVEGMLVAGANVTLTPSGSGATRQVTISVAGGGGGGAGDVVGPAAATAGALARFDGATGKLLRSSPVTLSDDGVLTLPVASVPSPPAEDQLALYARSVGGRMLPVAMGPSGLDSPLQPHLGLNRAVWWIPHGNSNTALTSMGITAVTTGTATAVNVTAGSLFGMMRRISYRVATAASNAVVGWRGGVNQYSVGGSAAGLGGFHMILRWGGDLGMTNASHRCFVGMRPTAAPTDVNPSTLTNLVGVGYDAADTTFHVLSNDASGTATKISLGAGFPKPGVDAQDVYELVLFSPPGLVQLVHYRLRNLTTGAEATGTVTSDLPSASTLIAPHMALSVGGATSVIGLSIKCVYIETDY